MDIKKYNEEFDYSYTLGGFPTFELVKNKSDYVQKIIISSKLEKNSEWKKLENICIQKDIPIEENDKQLNKIANKGNVFIAGVFKKYCQNVTPNQCTVVLNSPSDMGNLGTIMREMLGFGYLNLILIKPCADYFNPKVIRASMGAIFSLNISTFNNFEDFEKNNKLPLYLFMLNGTTNLSLVGKVQQPHALVFGNEATGLPRSYTNKGVSVKIHHSSNIDSLNLSMSAGIAMYEFSKERFK